MPVNDPNTNRHPQTARHEATSGVRRRVLTLDRIKSYSLAKFGYPQVTPDISEMQMGEFWERTLDEYNRWLPIEKYDIVTGTSSTRNQYNLEEIGKPYGRGVQDVKVTSNEDFFSPISGVFALGIPHPISHLSPDQYDLALRYIAVAKKIYSSEPDWEWEEPILWLYAPTGFGGPFVASYMYYQDALSPEDIPANDWQWVMEYFYNLCKESIGEARSKFGSIPGPAGQTLRSESMITEAQNKIKELEEKIQMRSYCRVPPLGPTGS